MNDKPRDEGHAAESWEFDEEVTRVFDDMLERSIPQYDVMRDTVLDMVDHFAPNGSRVVDLGAARGEATQRLIDRRGAQLRYTLVETSQPMVKALNERFQSWVDKGLMNILDWDLRNDYPSDFCAVTMAVLTIQFVPIEYRQQIIRRAFNNIKPGGAFILVEKVLGATADINETMVEKYLTKKRRSGYSQEEIDRKRLSLEGVLVPVTAQMNEMFLRSAGFQQIDCFWRWNNFAAWVALKPD